MEKVLISLLIFMEVVYGVSVGAFAGTSSAPHPILLQNDAPSLKQIASLDKSDLDELESYYQSGLSKIRLRFRKIGFGEFNITTIQKDLLEFLDLIAEIYAANKDLTKFVGVGSDSLFLSRAIEAKMLQMGIKPKIEWDKSIDPAKLKNTTYLDASLKSETIDKLAKGLAQGENVLLFGFLPNFMNCRWLGNRILNKVKEINSSKVDINLEVLGLQDKPFLGFPASLNVPKTIKARNINEPSSQFKSFKLDEKNLAENNSGFLGLAKAMSWEHAINNSYMGIAQELKTLERRALFIRLFSAMILNDDIKQPPTNTPHDKTDTQTLLAELKEHKLVQLVNILFSESENDTARLLLKDRNSISSFLNLIKETSNYNDEIGFEILERFAKSSQSISSAYWKSLPLELGHMVTTLNLDETSILKLIDWFWSSEERADQLISKHSSILDAPIAAREIALKLKEESAHISTHIIRKFAQQSQSEVSSIAKAVGVDRVLLENNVQELPADLESAWFLVPEFSGFEPLQNSGDDLTSSNTEQGKVVLKVLERVMTTADGPTNDLGTLFQLTNTVNAPWIHNGDVSWYVIALLQHLRSSDYISTFDLLKAMEVFLNKQRTISWNSLVQLSRFKAESGACEYILNSHQFLNAYFSAPKAFYLVTQAILDHNIESIDSLTDNQRIALISALTK